MADGQPGAAAVQVARTDERLAPGAVPEVIFDEGGERGEVSIRWEDGRISAWNPYERSIGRMVRIARDLGDGAHCEDDDGKRGYDEDGNYDPAVDA